MNREVRGRVAEEDEPRLVAPLALLDEFQGVFVEHVGGVELPLGPVDLLLATFGQAHVIVGIPLVVRMIEGVAVEFFETALGWPGLVVQVPLAHVVAAVARVAQRFAERDAPIVEAPQISRAASGMWLARRETGNASLRRVQPGHERSTARAAASRVIEGLEADAAFGQCVDVRCVNLPAVAAEV